MMIRICIYAAMLVLTSCTLNPKLFYPSYMQENLLKESWIFQQNLNPNLWTAQPPAGTGSSKTIKLPPFSTLKLSGDFNVRWTQDEGQPALRLQGPRSESNLIQVKVCRGTLYIYHPSDISTRHVMVQLGTHHLHSISNCGCSNIYADHVKSDGLAIYSLGSGHIYLNGCINLAKLFQLGSGTVIIKGIYSPCLDLVVQGSSNVYLGGRVGVRNIQHIGCGEVSILCADTDCLHIFAAGGGLTSVLGCVALKSVTALDSSGVYVFWVNSKNVIARAYQCARIGLAGSTCDLYACLAGNSRFEGSYLRARSGYLKTIDDAHANALFTDKLFAYVTGTSSIYYYGPANRVSRYIYDDAAALPVGHECIPQEKLFVSINLPCGPIPFRQIYP